MVQRKVIFCSIKLLITNDKWVFHCEKVDDKESLTTKTPLITKHSKHLRN